jgi:4-amino-4-deoxy-L-arabinose transferase-like glycosyltransferase
MMSETPEQQFSLEDQQDQQKLFIASAILLLIGLFLNLGVQPIYLEEPRRSFIALEMFYFNNYWVPFELGEFYYTKPPAFQWMIMLCVSLLGGFSEFAVRLPTVLSTIGIGVLAYWLGKKYVSKEFGQINGFLFILAGGILFYFSMLAEIDLFYSLVTFASFVCLFHFYQTKQYWILFFSVYFLGALGTLTKGFPSPLFLAFSIGGYLLYKRDLKRLFSAPHILAALMYLFLIFGYLYIYTTYHPLDKFIEGIWGQSSERTVLRQDEYKLIKHLFFFPLDILTDTLPSSLLLIFLIRKKLWQLLKGNELVAFCVIIFLVNIPVYWASPGTRQRYIYMLYPLLFMAFTYSYLQTRHLKDWRFKTFRILTGVLIVALAIGSIVINFISDLDFLSFRPLISILFFAALSAVFYIYLKRPNLTLATLILAATLSRILFDLTVLPQRAHNSAAQRDKDMAATLYEITGEEDLYIYRGRISFTTIYYLDVLREKPVMRIHKKIPDTYFISEVKWIDSPVDTIMEFDYKGKPVLLFEFRE